MNENAKPITIVLDEETRKWLGNKALETVEMVAAYARISYVLSQQKSNGMVDLRMTQAKRNAVNLRNAAANSILELCQAVVNTNVTFNPMFEPLRQVADEKGADDGNGGT